MQEATETLDASNSALSRPGKLNDHFTQLAQTGGKEVNAATLASSWNDRAKGMMREHAHTMIEHMQSFGKRGRSLTAADLVANSAADPLAPAA